MVPLIPLFIENQLVSMVYSALNTNWVVRSRQGTPRGRCVCERVELSHGPPAVEVDDGVQESHKLLAH